MLQMNEEQIMKEAADMSLGKIQNIYCEGFKLQFLICSQDPRNNSSVWSSPRCSSSSAFADDGFAYEEVGNGSWWGISRGIARSTEDFRMCCSFGRPKPCGKEAR